MELALKPPTLIPRFKPSPVPNRRRRPIINGRMKAVTVTSSGKLSIREVEDPPAAIGDDEVIIEVVATALNRGEVPADAPYIPPEGSSPYPGLECSGTVIAAGRSVARWKTGDQVCALLNGGGYAEKVVVPAAQLLPIPHGVSLIEAASFPEAACTVWSTIFMTSGLSTKNTLLIHGGSGGIGTFAIQIAKSHGARVFVTAGSEEKLAACQQLGADVLINYRTEDFSAMVSKETGGKGVDVILDHIGGPYLQRNLDSLAMDGRIFMIGYMGGMVTEVNLSCLLAKRLTVQGARLRHRSPENKAVIVEEVEKHVWPAIAAGKVKPVVYKSFPLSEATEAHRLMAMSANVGKMLLIP